ncbi:MAG: polyphosphate kinase 1 [Armatimonadota bacterium]
MAVSKETTRTAAPKARAARKTKTSPKPRSLVDSRLYINRELSWLQFNWRVLEEALTPHTPLLERVKFLAIFANNLDEFFMIRVSGLRRQLAAGTQDVSVDGMTPAEQLSAIRRELNCQLSKFSHCWHDDVLPALRAAGINVVHYAELKKKQRERLRTYCEHEVFPVLTPLAIDPSHPFPHISNLSLNLAVVVHDPVHGERFARLKVPDIFPRLLRISGEEAVEGVEELPVDGAKSGNHFVWLEEVIAANLDLLFPGLKVTAAYPFRITRDADLEIEEDEASDLLATIEESVEMRHFGSEVRLELAKSMPERLRNLLIRNVNIAPYLVYTVDGPIGMADLMELTKIERPDLKDPQYVPVVPPAFATDEDLFTVIRRQDVLLYHPYDSFVPVIDFVRAASTDPQVLAIKLALYRAGPNSPIVSALMDARENGKQVAVLVELKARFDEENNIAWARALEHAGVHVVYGLLGLKTHAKMCLVVRREQDGIVRYVHMSTGNYNSQTSRIYTDIGLFTCNPEIGADVSDLFNALTGYSRKEEYQKLLVAPGLMRRELLARIEREIQRHQQHGDGYIAFKMNALVDTACVQALYRASQAGVKVDLQIRGICCLRPGVPGVSETITVTSVVGRFLEHSRIYYFRNGGNDEVLLGSADLMPRNLDRRVETLFPIEDPHLREVLIRDILQTHLRDNIQSRRLHANGTFDRVHPEPGEAELDSQRWMMEHWGKM